MSKEWFTQEAVVMGVLIAAMGWGTVKLFEINGVQAQLVEQQKVGAMTTQQVQILVPQVHRLEDKIDAQICMLRYEPSQKEERLACIQSIIGST